MAFYELFANRKIKKTLGCNECYRKLALSKAEDEREMISPCNAIHHVCIHIGKPIFKCKFCDCQFTNGLSFSRHVRYRHGQKLAKRGLMVYLNDYSAEIIDMMQRCFGQKREKQEFDELAGNKTKKLASVVK